MKKEKMGLFYFLSFTWGLPLTLIGLIVLGFTRLFLNRFVYKYKVVAGRIAIIFKGDLPGGMNLGMVYIIDESIEFSYRLHTHEIGHSIQNIWFGPFFLPLIGLPSLIRAAFWPRIVRREIQKKGVRPNYDRIWFEGQATRLGEKYVGERVREMIQR